MASVLEGRAAELDEVSVFLAEPGRSGNSLVVRAEAGIGKTALIEAAIERTSGLQVQVARAVGLEIESEIGYAGLHALLAPWREHFTQLPTHYAQALDRALGFADGPAVDRLLVANAALELVRRAARSTGLAVVVDDVHWWDEASTTVLAFMRRRVQGLRVAVLCACRSEYDQLAAQVADRALELAPLQPESARRLVLARYPDLTPDVVSRLLQDAQGNPLALLELPAALDAHQRSGTAQLPGILPLGHRLLSHYTRRLEQLPRPTRSLLLLAVLDPGGDTLARAGLAHHTMTAHDLAPAEAAGLVYEREPAGAVEFRHPIIRSAVLELATSHERREAHRLLAHLHHGDEDRRTRHLAAAAIGPDEHVAHLLETSARRLLRRGDCVGAVNTLMRSGTLSPPGTARRRRLAEAAYLGADVAGRLRSAEALLEDARREDPDAGTSWQAAATMAHVIFYGDGDVEAPHRLMAQAFAGEGPLDSGDEVLLGAMHTWLMICWSGGRGELWAEFRAALERMRPHPPSILDLASRTLADPARLGPGDVRRIEELITALPHEHESTRIVRTGLAAINLHRTSECRAAYTRVMRDGREGGAVGSAIKAMVIMSTEDFWTGRWAEAEHEAHEALEYCNRHGFQFLEYTARHTLGLLAAVTGRTQEAARIADEMTSWALPRRSHATERHALQIRLHIALGAGEFEQAYRLAADISAPGALASHVPQALLTAFDLVEAAVRTGRDTQARAHAAALAQARGLSLRVSILADACLAITSPDEEAPELFEQALAATGGDRWPLDRARIHLLYGERLRRARAKARSAEHLERAAEIFTRMPAPAWAERARAELRAAGRAGAEPEQGRPALLTARQAEIAALAAAGLTNREIGARLFLSPKTVGFHLHQIFPKLAITTRAALRDALAAADLKIED